MNCEGATVPWIVESIGAKGERAAHPVARLLCPDAYLKRLRQSSIPFVARLVEVDAVGVLNVALRLDADNRERVLPGAIRLTTDTRDDRRAQNGEIGRGGNFDRGIQYLGFHLRKKWKSCQSAREEDAQRAGPESLYVQIYALPEP